MSNTDVQKKCERFLREMGIEGFIVFAWKSADDEINLVYSLHDMPVNMALKGMSWALNDFANKVLV